MYLVDTNVWLEVLLKQQQAKVASDFLTKTPANKLYLSEFSLYSIGVITSRLNKSILFDAFVNDVLVKSPVNRVKLSAGDLMQMGKLKTQHQLDFDDAYQYLIAVQYKLTIVSFDADFDQTPLGRTEPSKLI